MTNHQIAQSLGVSDHTVKKQRDLIQTEEQEEPEDEYIVPYSAFSKDDLAMFLQDEVRSEDEIRESDLGERISSPPRKGVSDS